MTKDNLALILAREGSNTISRQNLRLVNGKPLIKYVIEQVLAEKSCDVYVSTDSNEIKELSKMYGIKTIDRPKSLAMDHAAIEEITLHAISYLRDNGIVYKKCLVINPMFPLIKKQIIKSFFSYLNTRINTINMG
jgi:CMP-N-acetylneuraminic acid synthetase